MWSFFKKLVSVLIVLYVVALILNLKIGGKPTRDWTMQAWNSPQVQKIYHTVKDRIMALIRKDINVEDVFKSNPTGAASPATQGGKVPESLPSQVPPKGPEEVKTINLEHLDEKDREELNKILQKSAQ